jgi:protein phosphatase
LFKSPSWLYFAYVGWLFRNGQINERDAKSHLKRNVLQKVLGADPQRIEPQVGAVGLEPGDRFLICTDLVTDGLFDIRIEDILRNTPRDAAPPLVRETITASGRDNATALVVDIFGQEFSVETSHASRKSLLLTSSEKYQIFFKL